MLGAVRVTVASLEGLVNRIARQYGVDPNLVKAIIKQESGWDVNASRYEMHLGDTSWGLMQVLLKTGRWILDNNQLTIQDLIRPEINIAAGTKYIGSHLKKYKGNVKDSIAAYNAGSARRKKDGSYVNQDYVDSVSRYYTMYKTLGPAGSVLVTQANPMSIGIVGLALAGLVYTMTRK